LLATFVAPVKPEQTDLNFNGHVGVDFNVNVLNSKIPN
jgi:hypothetical protein